MDKTATSLRDSIADIQDGATVMIGGFGGSGSPIELIHALIDPLLLLFWDGDAQEGFEARAKILYDRTITEHLDLESMVFLAERLRQLLEAPPPDQPNG